MKLTKKKGRVTNKWFNDYIAPGNVGSIGAFAVTPRFRQSCSDMPNRYDPAFSGLNALLNGSNVQNGTDRSFVSGGGPATVFEAGFEGGRGFKTDQGTVFQDLQPADRATIAITENGFKPAELKVFNTFSKFPQVPLPGGYEPKPGAIPRGGSEPQITGFYGGEELLHSNRVVGNGLPQGANLARALSGRPVVKMGSSK